MATDAGMTLVETLVATALTVVVMASASSAFIASSRSLGRTADDSEGLQDVRTVTDRLSRDLLAARGVDPTSSDANHLTVWIDDNSDYRQTPAETVTWTISGGSPGHYNVVRTTGAGGSTVEGRTLVSDIAFSYDTGSPSTTTRTVHVAMDYDAQTGRYAGGRRVLFDVRMRNVE